MVGKVTTLPVPYGQVTLPPRTLWSGNVTPPPYPMVRQRTGTIWSGNVTGTAIAQAYRYRYCLSKLFTFSS